MLLDMINETYKDIKTKKWEKIEELSQALSTLVYKYLGDICLGIYVYGSYFTDEFNPESSDLDFSAFLTRKIDKDICTRIRTLHSHLVQICPIARFLEGEYYYLNYDFVWDKQTSVLLSKGGTPCLDESTIDPDILEMIRSRGYAVYGKAAQYVLPNVTYDMTSRYYKDYILETLNLLDCHDLLPELLWHKVLNTCRAYYFVVNNNLPSKKRHAALWAMGRMPKYANIIQRALDVRDNKCELQIDEYITPLKEMLQSFLTDDYDEAHSLKGYALPMRAEIQMTTKCNCCCPHCGYFTINNIDSTCINNIFSFLEETKQAWGWIDRILYEGGEPTIEFHRLMLCIKKAKDLLIPNIQINTNLINVTKEHILQLIDAGCNYIEVSVDAISEDGWHKMRGLKKTEHTAVQYAQFIEVLRFICNRPELIVDFNYTPTTANISELQAVYQAACEFGARYFSFQNL